MQGNRIQQVKCAGMKLCLPLETLSQEYKHKSHEQLPTFFHTHSIKYESLLKEIDSTINHLALVYMYDLD